MSGTTKKLQLLGKLQSGVYILSEGETLADAPIDADVVIDPYSAEAVFPEGGSGGATTWEDLGTIGYTNESILSGHELTYMGEDMFAITEPFELVPGKEYDLWINTDTVPASGSTGSYICMAEMVYDGDIAAGVALGNTSVIGGTIESDAPFILFYPMHNDLTSEGIYGMFMSLDGATSANIRSITGPVAITRPIPTKYLPGHLVVNFAVSTNLSESTMDKTFQEIIDAMSMNPIGVVGVATTEMDNSSSLILRPYSFSDNSIVFTSDVYVLDDAIPQVVAIKVDSDDAITVTIRNL